MTKTIVIMIGIQGSGKSEFCRQHLADGYTYISLDELHTRKAEQNLIAQCFSDNSSFVVDNTNVTSADRSRYIIPAKTNGYGVVGYFMQSSLRECIARNNSRSGRARIPAKAIAATSNKLEMPSLAEGFDELYYVQNDGFNMTVSEWREINEL